MLLSLWKGKLARKAVRYDRRPKISIACIDQLRQIENELRTIWLALGNTTDLAEDYLRDVREAVNGVTNRLDEACTAMEKRGERHG